jgi:hypothetical protein
VFGPLFPPNLAVAGKSGWSLISLNVLSTTSSADLKRAASLFNILNIPSNTPGRRRKAA